MLPMQQLCESLAPATLDLPFRKNRSYIHTSDLFPALTALARNRFSADAYLSSLVLRRQARRQLRACFEPAPESLGTFSIRYREQQIDGCLVETEKEVALRIPYDDSRAEAAVIREPGRARFAQPVPGYTAFEQLIVLLQAVVADQGAKRLWLCQIDFDGPLHESEPLATRVRQILMHRFVVFELRQADRLLGSARAILQHDEPDFREAAKEDAHG